MFNLQHQGGREEKIRISTSDAANRQAIREHPITVLCRRDTFCWENTSVARNAVGFDIDIGPLTGYCTREDR
jgi:hypothetical protein